MHLDIHLLQHLLKIASTREKDTFQTCTRSTGSGQHPGNLGHTEPTIPRCHTALRDERSASHSHISFKKIAPTIRVGGGENFHESLLQAAAGVGLQELFHLLRGGLSLLPEENTNCRGPAPSSSTKLR